MIWESYYWKAPLIESAERIRALTRSRSGLSDEEFVQLEKDIFLGFYSIRKLMEALGKLTDRVKLTRLTLRCYPNLKRVDSSNNHRLDELYDLDSTFTLKKEVKFVCGRVIHSYILSPIVSENGVLEGLAFTSDIDRNKRLYTLSANQVSGLFNRIGRDNVVSLVQVRNSTTGEMKVISVE